MPLDYFHGSQFCSETSATFLWFFFLSWKRRKPHSLHASEGFGSCSVWVHPHNGFVQSLDLFLPSLGMKVPKLWMPCTNLIEWKYMGGGLPLLPSTYPQPVTLDTSEVRWDPLPRAQATLELVPPAMWRGSLTFPSNGPISYSEAKSKIYIVNSVIKRRLLRAHE